MPYVNVKITQEAVTSQQKAELIKGVTSLFQDILNKKPATTVVVMDEVDTDNWGMAGEQVILDTSILLNDRDFSKLRKPYDYH